MTRAKETLVPTTPHVEGDDDIGEIAEIVGFHIRLAHGAVYRHFTETFTDLDLTQKMVSVLWLVADHPDISQSDLAKLMRMDRATTMAIVNRLQGRKLLVRGRALDDKRKQTLNLTEEGRKMLRKAKAAIREHEKWLKSRFTPEEVETFVGLLSRIHE